MTLIQLDFEIKHNDWGSSCLPIDLKFELPWPPPPKVVEQGTLVWELSCPFACSMTSLGTIICLFCLVPSDITGHHLLTCALHFKFRIPDWRTLLHDFEFSFFDIVNKLEAS